MTYITSWNSERQGLDSLKHLRIDIEALASVPGPPVVTSTIDIIGVAPTSPRGIVKPKVGFMEASTGLFGLILTLASLPGPPVDTLYTVKIGVAPISPLGIVNSKLALVSLPIFTTEAFVPGLPVSVEAITNVPVSPFSP